MEELFRPSSTCRQGSTYKRKYHTGTFDSTDCTPRFTLLDAASGIEKAVVQVSRLSAPFDPSREFAVVISRSDTYSLDPNRRYVINVDFDTPDGETIPHGTITLTVELGVKHP